MASNNSEQGSRPMRARSERRSAQAPEPPEQPEDEEPSAPRQRRRVRRRRVSDDGYLSFGARFTESTYYALKRAADDRDMYGYEICEEAVVAWLKENNYLVDSQSPE